LAWGALSARADPGARLITVIAVIAAIANRSVIDMRRRIEGGTLRAMSGLTAVRRKFPYIASPQTASPNPQRKDWEAIYFYSARGGEINCVEMEAEGPIRARRFSLKRDRAEFAPSARPLGRRSIAGRIIRGFAAVSIAAAIAACTAASPPSRPAASVAAPIAPAPASTPTAAPLPETGAPAAFACTRTPSASAATVAVADFEGGSIPPDKKTEFWGRALATFMIADLACSNSLRLVDREHLADILREQRLSASDLSDPATRIRVGKILGARYFIFGSYTIVGDEAALTARMDSVETGQIIEAKSVSGKADQMRDLSQRLAVDFLGPLDQAVAAQEARPNGAGAPPPEAVAHYNRGLMDEQRGDYGQAVDEYAHALALDANYRQARERLEKASESAARQ
jgi:TolB-like protein